MDVSIILPSLNPDEKLMKVVNGLIEQGFDDIIIVNDGSNAEHIKPFEEAGMLSQCTILTHEVNKGKGRALKTAFEYFLANRKGKAGVITVDGDNQHRPDDIYHCGQEMLSNHHSIILGSRDFSQHDVPKKSRYGNRITSFVFKVAVGLKINDTQTGLRAIPTEYLESLLEVEGERFEYETNMLLDMKTHSIPFKEVKISTVYIEENKTSHFNPVKDSFRIYSLILKFLFTSIFSSIVDLVAFILLMCILEKYFDRRLLIFIATFGARLISSLVNFTLNHKKVFKSQESMGRTVIRYYILCVIQATVSFGSVYLISKALSLTNSYVTLIKIFVDTILYFISFQIQREWVFKKHDKVGEQHV